MGVRIRTSESTLVGASGSLTFSPNGKFLAEGPTSRENIQIRDVETRKVVQTLASSAKLDMNVPRMAYSQGGRVLIACDNNTFAQEMTVPHRINLWDMADGSLAHQLTIPAGLPPNLDVSPNGREPRRDARRQRWREAERLATGWRERRAGGRADTTCDGPAELTWTAEPVVDRSRQQTLPRTRAGTTHDLSDKRSSKSDHAGARASSTGARWASHFSRGGGEIGPSGPKECGWPCRLV